MFKTLIENTKNIQKIHMTASKLVFIASILAAILGIVIILSFALILNEKKHAQDLVINTIIKSGIQNIK